MLCNNRRQFLKQALIAVFASFCGLISRTAASQSFNHFNYESFSQTMNRLFGDHPILDTDLIKLGLPEIAENGAIVPISISCELENIRRIYLLVEKNPMPLVAEFEFGSLVAAFLTARIKMAESCDVLVIAEHEDGRFLSRRQWVKIVQGGCGTG